MLFWMNHTETTTAVTQTIGIATLIRNLARSLFSPKLRDLEQPEQQPGEGDRQAKRRRQPW
jgi:hypothetical protein